MLVDKPQASKQIVDKELNMSGYFRLFLTSVANALNGTSGVVGAGISQVTLGNGVSMSSGAGSPEGIVPGNLGDLYSNLSGGAGATLWVKESGAAASNTGWQAK